MDECWLDVTASGASFGNGMEIAETIRENCKRGTRADRFHRSFFTKSTPSSGAT